MSSEDRLSRRDELETLLPFYLNGTLEGRDLRAVEDWLEQDPAAMAALAEAEMEFAEVGAVNETIMPPADALARFSKALDAQASPRTATLAADAPSLMARVTGWVLGAPSGLAWGAAAALLAVVVIQNVGSRPAGGEISVAGAEDPVAAMPFALVTFRPDATMEAVLAALNGAGATVISGPSGGVFKIGIPAKTAADYDSVLEKIVAAGVTQSAITGRKPADG